MFKFNKCINIVKIRGAKVPPPFLSPKMICQASPTPKPDAKNLFTIE